MINMRYRMKEEKLKTLKDLEIPFGKQFEQDSSERLLIWSDIIRKSAIEWIKWLDLHSKIEEVYKNETKSSDEAYYCIIDKKLLENVDKESARHLIRERQAIKQWIKYFFGIAEEDLKENDKDEKE